MDIFAVCLFRERSFAQTMAAYAVPLHPSLWDGFALVIGRHTGTPSNVRLSAAELQNFQSTLKFMVRNSDAIVVFSGREMCMDILKNDTTIKEGIVFNVASSILENYPPIWTGPIA